LTAPRVQGDEPVESPDGQTLRFQTTAKASADARALTHVGLARFDLIIDGVAVVLALVLLATGNVLLGVAVIVIAGLSLAGSRSHPLQRALIAIRFRSMLGQTTEVTIEDGGLRFVNPWTSSFVPWSSINAIRFNSRTVAFFRDRVLLGYIPSIAFESPAAQSRVVAFAQSRIAGPP
jgi:hypothetical protein